MPKSRKLRPSSTNGKDKAAGCKKSPLKIRMAKDSRFHKTDPLNYTKAIEEINKLHDKK